MAENEGTQGPFTGEDKGNWDNALAQMHRFNNDDWSPETAPGFFIFFSGATEEIAKKIRSLETHEDRDAHFQGVKELIAERGYGLTTKEEMTTNDLQALKGKTQEVFGYMKENILAGWGLEEREKMNDRMRQANKNLITLSNFYTNNAMLEQSQQATQEARENASIKMTFGKEILPPANNESLEDYLDTIKNGGIVARAELEADNISPHKFLRHEGYQSHFVAHGYGYGQERQTFYYDPATFEDEATLNAALEAKANALAQVAIPVGSPAHTAVETLVEKFKTGSEAIENNKSAAVKQVQEAWSNLDKQWQAVNEILIALEEGGALDKASTKKQVEDLFSLALNAESQKHEMVDHDGKMTAQEYDQAAGDMKVDTVALLDEMSTRLHLVNALYPETLSDLEYGLAASRIEWTQRDIREARSEIIVTDIPAESIIAAKEDGGAYGDDPDVNDVNREVSPFENLGL